MPCRSGAFQVIKELAKHVESLSKPSPDAGSNPATSTKVDPNVQSVGIFFFRVVGFEIEWEIKRKTPTVTAVGVFLCLPNCYLRTWTFRTVTLLPTRISMK